MSCTNLRIERVPVPHPCILWISFLDLIQPSVDDTYRLLLDGIHTHTGPGHCLYRKPLLWSSDIFEVLSVTVVMSLLMGRIITMYYLLLYTDCILKTGFITTHVKR